MKTIKYPKQSEWLQICERPAVNTADLNTMVSGIFDEIRKNGDATLSKYTHFFDKVQLNSFEVPKSEIDEAEKALEPELKDAINLAKTNIEKFHASQIENAEVVETAKGVSCWRENRAIEKVGLYIPGGTAPLFSTVLMLGVPANLAGCKEIILCSPPDKNGKINPAVLFTAKLLGIGKIYRVGGIQAIGALTFGTESIPKVDKIFGPGNQYVTAAKQMAQNCGVAIDMPAGPSEVLVLADESCEPAFVAADLLSQAEHGSDSQVMLVSDNEKIIKEVSSEISKQLKNLPRQETAAKALENSQAILLKDLNACMDFSNTYAPEHLIIATENSKELAAQVQNAGSVFIGNYSCESLGDYASGTNHTLPTNGFARNYSGVSVDSFVKKITFQEITREGIQNIGPAVEIMAEAENLFAHKNAVSIRLEKIKKS